MTTFRSSSILRWRNVVWFSGHSGRGETSDVDREDAILDQFLGTDAFIRVGGSPPWLGDPELPNCDECQSGMSFAVGVGYEGEGCNLVGGEEPFFLGEFAFYFFYCSRCDRVSVILQA